MYCTILTTAHYEGSYDLDGYKAIDVEMPQELFDSLHIANNPSRYADIYFTDADTEQTLMNEGILRLANTRRAAMAFSDFPEEQNAHSEESTEDPLLTPPIPEPEPPLVELVVRDAETSLKILKEIYEDYVLDYEEGRHLIVEYLNKAIMFALKDQTNPVELLDKIESECVIFVSLRTTTGLATLTYPEDSSLNFIDCCISLGFHLAPMYSISNCLLHVKGHVIYPITYYYDNMEGTKDAITESIRVMAKKINERELKSKVEAISEFVVNKTAKSIETVSSKIVSLDGELKELFNTITQKAGLLTSFKKQKELLEIAVNDKAKYAQTVVEEINNFPEIKAIYTSKESFVIYTNPIKAFNPKDRTSHIIGELMISISASGIYIQNLWGDIDGKGFPHCYDRGYSSVCMGNISSDIPFLFGSASYQELIAYALGFVQTANMEDTFGKHLNKFPLDPYDPINEAFGSTKINSRDKYSYWDHDTTGFWTTLTKEQIREKFGYPEDAKEYCDPWMWWRFNG